MKKEYDIIVIGGGHAGCEAVAAAAKMGCSALLLTMSADTIGSISCNPSIGGLAKGQLVKEVGALGGIMAKAADATMTQFRILNTRKGPAVRSSRAQIDRHAYSAYVKAAINSQGGLDVRDGTAEEILTENGRVTGVRTTLNEKYTCRAAVVTTGTFLNGAIHIGLEHFEGGRMGEKSSIGLSGSLRNLGLNLGRLKTGTCARLDGKTIDFDRLAVQQGDTEIIPFSFDSEKICRKQLPCHITYTNEKTHEIIRSNMDRSPLFTGVIKGTGARYCPSIEDKIYRFPERGRHHIFLEPEGLDTAEYYPNGISTSLPLDVQEKIIHSITGLENARITRPGYGIEYDYADPAQLFPTLETKNISGLFLAGQINGTTGYEEAAALGLMSGINAALKIRGDRPLILRRSEAYIGVLIDDLVTKGTDEPYRMFTSRVEYRLLLREDNADIRLSPIGHKLGLIGDAAYKKVIEKKMRVENKIVSLKAGRLEKILRRPGVSYSDLTENGDADPISREEARSVEAEIKYEGYIRRQLGEIARMNKIDRIRIPDDTDYSLIHGLSTEIIEKMSRVRPLNLGQAARISGITPAAVSIIMVYLDKLRRMRRHTE